MSLYYLHLCIFAGISICATEHRLDARIPVVLKTLTHIVQHIVWQDGILAELCKIDQELGKRCVCPIASLRHAGCRRRGRMIAILEGNSPSVVEAPLRIGKVSIVVIEYLVESKRDLS